MKAVWISAALVAGTTLAQPTEFVEEASVIRVEPIAGEPLERGCGGAKPTSVASGAGLVDMLRWDLCRHVIKPEPTGYRVFYRWDDRTYSRVMADEPGPTVPIRVRYN